MKSSIINNRIKHIFYVHKGNSKYLQESLRQVRLKNPESEIILLGEGIDVNICEGIKYEDINIYNNYAKEFEKYYIHLSDKEYSYEIFCIQRWFIILEYMKINNIKNGFYQDSDVILDCNIEEIDYDNKFWYCDCSGHTSAFTVEILGSLCEFILNYYKCKETLIDLCEMRSHMKHINELEKWTNITDMELISLFVYYNDEKVCNIGNRINGGIFGFNINAQDHTNAFHMHKYDFIDDKSKIYFMDNKLFVKDAIINKFERIFSIHFHSDTKMYMEEFIKYNKLDSSTGIFYFDFNSVKWERENNRNEKDIIDYKIYKEAIVNCKNHNLQYSDAYLAIEEFIKRNDFDLTNIDSEIKNLTLKKYEQLNLNSKKIVGWGCGNGLNIIGKYYNIKFDYFVDVDVNKIGKKLKDVAIYNISKILEDKDDIFIIVLSISHYNEIRHFLEVIGFKKNHDFISMESLIGYLSTSIDSGR